MNQSSSGICRSCNASVEFLLDFGNQPIVNNLQVEPSNVARFPIEIVGCSNCGLVQILNPIDPAEFYTNYANSSSVKREPHLEKLIEKLESLLPKSAKIIDIGCNDGKFLSILRESGFEDLYGLEPTKNMSTLAISAGFRIYNSYLDLKKSEEIVANTGKFDCVVLRQVLEHIENLPDFGSALRNLLKPNGLLVIEVPDSEAWYKSRDYALWEEHISYFDERSLQFFLRLHNFNIFDSYRSIFAGVTLTVFSRGTENSNFTIVSTDNTVELFRAWAIEFSKFKLNIQTEVKSFIESQLDVAVYGIGARSSCFLNYMDISKLVSLAIDDDPAKQGKYLPGTDILIRSRDDGFSLLKENSLILLGVNGENENKLLNQIAPFKSCQFKSILPPSDFLLSAFN